MNSLITKATGKVATLMGKTGLKLQKYSPQILLGVGVVAGAAGVYLACRATIKAEDAIYTYTEAKEYINEAKEKGESLANEYGETVPYSEEDAKDDMKKLTMVTVGSIAKAYAPAAGVLALSLTCFLSSYGVLHKRNVAVTAAYNALDAAYKKYRANVVEAYGEEVDENLKIGRVTQKIETIEVDEKGKEKKVKKEVKVLKNPNDVSTFARYFDQGATNQWKNDPDYNLMFIKQTQAYCNQLLHSRGYLFLNEVYDALGFARVPEGQAVGWLLEDPDSDGFVDFGIYDGYSQECIDFVNGINPSLLLDFNVDGVIWDKI